VHSCVWASDAGLLVAVVDHAVHLAFAASERVRLNERECHFMISDMRDVVLQLLLELFEP